MDDKVTIKLKPFDALAIYSFLNEFKPQFGHPKLKALSEAIQEYQKEVEKRLTNDQITDAYMQREIFRAIGTEPDPDEHTKN
jgi:hypothetical protein